MKLVVPHFFRGKFIEGNVPLGDYEIIAYSKELTLDYIQNVFKTVYIGSHSYAGGIERDFRGYVGFQFEDKYIFAEVKRSELQDRGKYYPIYHAIVLPFRAYEAIKGNLSLFRDLISLSSIYPVVPVQVNDLELLPISLPVPTLETEKNILDTFSVNPASLLNLLSMILSNKKILLAGVPVPIRFEIAQAIILLLPPPVRNIVSFATEVFEGGSNNIQLQFQYHDQRANRDGIFWSEFTENGVPHRYTSLIELKWKQGTEALLELIHRISAYLVKIQENHKELDIGHQLYILANGILLKDELLSDTGDIDNIKNAILLDPLLVDEDKKNYFKSLINLYLEKDIKGSVDLFNIPGLYQLLQLHPSYIGESLEKKPKNIFPLLELWLGNATGEVYVNVTNLVMSLGIQYWSRVLSSEIDARSFFALMWSFGVFELCLEWLQSLSTTSSLNDEWKHVIEHTISTTQLEPVHLERISTLITTKSLLPEVSALICSILFKHYGFKASRSLQVLIENHWLNGQINLEFHNLITLIKLQNDHKSKNIIFDKTIKQVSDSQMSAGRRAELLYQILSAYTKPKTEKVWFGTSNGLRQFIHELEQSVNLIDILEKYSEQSVDKVEDQTSSLLVALKELSVQEVKLLSRRLDIFIGFLNSLNGGTSRFKILTRTSNASPILDALKQIRELVIQELLSRQN